MYYAVLSHFFIVFFSVLFKAFLCLFTNFCSFRLHPPHFYVHLLFKLPFTLQRILSIATVQNPSHDISWELQELSVFFVAPWRLLKRRILHEHILGFGSLSHSSQDLWNRLTYAHQIALQQWEMSMHSAWCRTTLSLMLAHMVWPSQVLCTPSMASVFEKWIPYSHVWGVH